MKPGFGQVFVAWKWELSAIQEWPRCRFGMRLETYWQTPRLMRPVQARKVLQKSTALEKLRRGC
jgi:hypothetical protein